MARMRAIKPGFFTNDLLAEIEPLGRLLFAGLWTIADRAGRLEDRPRKIKAELLPYDDCDPDALLDALAARGFVVRYVVNGTRLLQVQNWAKHQQPHVNERESDYAAPVQALELHGTSTVQVPERSDTNPSEQNSNSTRTELEDGAREVSAADAAPLQRAVPKKPPGPSLTPLVDAFDARDLPRPSFERGEGKAAQSLLSTHSPDVIAACWQDFASGEYGNDYSKRELSFVFLAGGQRIANWQRWKAQPATARAPNGTRKGYRSLSNQGEAWPTKPDDPPLNEGFETDYYDANGQRRPTPIGGQ